MKLITGLARAGRRLRHGERGFSLLELAVAMAVFATVMSAAVYQLGGALTLTRNDRSRAVAANLAEREMDVVRSTDFTDLPAGKVKSSATVDGVKYNIKRQSKWVAKDTTTSSCGISGTNYSFLRVTVTITWPNMAGTVPVMSQTILTPPVGTYDPNSGALAVQVFDRDGAGETDVDLTAVGPGGAYAQTTDDDGCALFAFLAPGSYQVALSDPGYVDGQSNPNPKQTIAVSVGVTVSVQFDYDLGSILTLALQGKSGGVPPNNTPVTLGNTHLLPLGTKILPGVVGATVTSGLLFPYRDGYQAWAGSCLDADPQGQKPAGGGPYFPGAVRDPAISVSPGVPASGTVTMKTFTVTVKKLGLAVPGMTVVMTHAADNACPGGQALTLTGVTDATGKVTAAVPFGTWTVSVSGKLPAITWPVATITPPASSGPQTLQVNIR